MIVGIGMDLVSVRRVAELLARHDERALRRLFTAGEVGDCQARGRPIQSFAARFAAKEACFKALGTGWAQGVSWREIEVVSAPSRAPALRLYGAAAARAAERGARRLHLSLTHTEEFAAAVVVLEGGGAGNEKAGGAPTGFGFAIH